MLTVYTRTCCGRKILDNIEELFALYQPVIEQQFNTMDNKLIQELTGVDIRKAAKNNPTQSLPLKNLSKGIKTCLLVHHLPTIPRSVVNTWKCKHAEIVALLRYIKSSNNPILVSFPYAELSWPQPELSRLKVNLNNRGIGDYYDLCNETLFGRD